MADSNVKKLWVSAVLRGDFVCERRLRQQFDILIPTLLSVKRPEIVTSLGTSAIMSGEIQYDVDEPRWPFNRRVSHVGSER